VAETVGASLKALGDVEFVVVQLERDRLIPRVLEALLRQVEAGTIRLLDFLIIDRSDRDDCTLVEVDGEDFALAGLGLDTRGLICEDDVHHFVSRVAVGTRAALILVEPTWSERFAHDVDCRVDRIVARQPIPAAIANAVLESALRQA
jgi:hypothetical protein